MFIQTDEAGRERFVTSASDLTAVVTCEFAWLRRVDAKLGRQVVVPRDDDEMRARAAVLGDDHEARVLAEYISEFGLHSLQPTHDVGLDSPELTFGRAGVAVITAPESMTLQALETAQANSIAALRASADVVFQATFFDPQQSAAAASPAAPALPELPEIGFVGFADFLVKTAQGDYEVQDTKLARTAKVTALLQLAAYAEQLERLGIPVAAEAALILGDGSVSRHLVADIAPVFRRRRARLHALLLERITARSVDGTREHADPIAWGAAGITACGRCEVCEPEVETHRDPLLIAGIRVTQRDRLYDAGYTTIEEVAAILPNLSEASLQVPGIAHPVVERLAKQAAVQTRSTVDGLPAFEVIHADSLRSIPQPDQGDIFFDFEGDPMFRAPVSSGLKGETRASTVSWGIDYLFGWVDQTEEFHSLWAFDIAEERAAFTHFMEYLTERRTRYPNMHIYHYAAYERTHMLSLAARHQIFQQEVDELLRSHIFVDLFPIVKNSLCLGSRSYSIKKLEPLYMGADLRNQDGVTNGAQSVVEFAEASAQLASADPRQRELGQHRIDAISDYNQYDCVSTLRLRDWLLKLARVHGVVSVATDDEDTLAFEATRETALPEHTESALAKRLLALSAAMSEERDARTLALAASAIDYHRREDTSYWWAHFSRLIDPVQEWSETRDVMVVNALGSEVEQDWYVPEGRARTLRRQLFLRGELAPGSSIKPGGEVMLVYPYPGPFELPGAAPGAKSWIRAKVLESTPDGIRVEEMLKKQVEPYGDIPLALTPGPPPPAGTQKSAIEEWGSQLATSVEAGSFPHDPVVDVMRREKPRLRGMEHVLSPGSEPALAVGGSEDARTIGATLSTVRALTDSALAVQGPPGTGKTYLAARVIRALVEQDGWHIGVVGQSHKVVENVLQGVVRAGLADSQVGKVAQGAGRSNRAASGVETDAENTIYTDLPANGQRDFVEGHRVSGRGSVTGGTAWDFSNEKRFDRRSLDLLVVDEAGQFSLAPTIAAAVSAQRVLLLGDPQQLPQVSQGTHLEPVDTSALGWLLDGHGTIAERLGYFLAETRRMRPELTEVVSELSYEGRLRAHTSASAREVTGLAPAGLHWVPVRHFGNSTHSVEEGQQVVQLVAQALTAALTESGHTREIEQSDVIVVAAYNAQVECVRNLLDAAGFTDVRVGTVDKFQGQEAVIALVTLAASSAQDVPRGLEFLLMKNRLNVAISRAQWAAFLISSDRLGDGMPTSAEAVTALSGYLRLTERGSLSV